jgi:selenocysteine lyase/cysteine desulfurase
MSQENFSANTIYLDQAATSRPKAAGVGEAMRTYIEEVCANVNRSTYAPSTNAALHVLETREYLCSLFGLNDPTHAIFTPGQTASLNMVLKGYLHPGDHVLVSALECGRSHSCLTRAFRSTASPCAGTIRSTLQRRNG